MVVISPFNQDWYISLKSPEIADKNGFLRMQPPEIIYTI